MWENYLLIIIIETISLIKENIFIDFQYFIEYIYFVNYLILHSLPKK